MTIDDAKSEFSGACKDWLADTVKQPLSETDTRCKAIDYVLLDVLGWSESNIKREEKLVETTKYIDYVLSTVRPMLVVEAKRSDFLFNLPSIRNGRRFKVGGALSEDKNLLAAILQAQIYAISKGILFAV